MLKVIEFTSERKKMSVVVKRDSDGRVFNFIKGADSGIMNVLKEGEADSKSETVEHVNAFAYEGLRTLVFAVKELDGAVTEGSLQDMSEEDLESDLELLGVTGLEDILQENVHSCIQQFILAGIKVWMLTGDKGETAHTIAISCGLIDPKKHKIEAVSENELSKLQERIRSLESKMGAVEVFPGDVEKVTASAGPEEYSVLIDGQALALIHSDPDSQLRLARTLRRASSVVVFRCSPDEKA